MGKSTVEVAHLIQAARKLFSLVRQDGPQFVRDFIASAGRAQARKVGRLSQRKVELPQSDQKSQTGQVRFGVVAVPLLPRPGAGSSPRRS